MNDQTQRLRAAIAELERELAHLESSDPETRALLQSAAQDIGAALSKPATSSAAASPSVPTGQQEKVATSKNLFEAKVLEFEASHPKISVALTRLIDALGQIGI
jgi:peptidoglycan hydrolase CwlO-like protein